jgi:hypothetical protein
MGFGRGQGCSILQYPGIVQEIIQAQSVVIERFTDIGTERRRGVVFAMLRGT